MNTQLSPLNRQTAAVNNTYRERVIQFGGGNFLRGFVDWIIEQLNTETTFASSVVVIKPTASGSYDQWTEQEGLFHVQLHGLQDNKLVTSCELITCVSRALNPYHDHAAFLALACQPDIRFIISNTTEMGIAFVRSDQLSDTPPSSFPAKLTQFLYQRFEHFQGAEDKGCIILPCELVEQNGRRLKQIVLQYADLWQLNAAFKTWIETSNQFYNTLVDRIVTGFPKQDSQAVLERIGFNDQLLVEAESYHNWIIEAPSTLNDELPIAQTKLNVHIVDDAEPHRRIKVRILNGAHTCMVPLGYFLGLETVRQVVEHRWLGDFIHTLMLEEVLPTFGTSDPMLTAFADAAWNRFRNPFIQHRLLSIALNSISKFKVRLLPTLTIYAESKQQLPHRIVFAFAALIRFYKGEWAGAEIPLNDDPATIAWIREVWQTAANTQSVAEQLLANQQLWDQDLLNINGLHELLSNYLARLEEVSHQLVVAAKTSVDERAALAASLLESASRHSR
ncbi:MAG: tagaturonate reductase [Anaerolineae bacterium]|nr:tagaturonate reductase [Anaerolineae bacterium]